MRRPPPIPGVTVRAGSPGCPPGRPLQLPQQRLPRHSERPEASERREGLSQKAEKVVLKVGAGVGEKVGTELTMIFFLPPLTVCRELCAFIFAHSSGSDLLYNYVTFYLLCHGISSSATSRGFLAGPCDAATQGLSSQRCRNQKEREMVGDAVRINAPAFLSFSPVPFLLYSFNLPE